jgi:Fe-S-cluster-containing hydrogenase component 2
MTPKVIVVNPLKCNGCKECEVACSKKHTGENRPDQPRIHVISLDHNDGFYLPTTCQQCDDPPCMAVCPNDAISRDNDMARVMITPEHCIGCKMCVSACPTGAMGFDDVGGRAFKCDLCDGNPECVRVCEPKALEYLEAHKLQHQRMGKIANKFYGVMGKKAA